MIVCFFPFSQMLSVVNNFNMHYSFLPLKKIYNSITKKTIERNTLNIK
jgi:hypothetical protein